MRLADEIEKALAQTSAFPYPMAFMLLKVKKGANRFQGKSKAPGQHSGSKYCKFK